MARDPFIAPVVDQGAICLWSSPDLAACVMCEHTDQGNGDQYAWLSLWLRGAAADEDFIDPELGNGRIPISIDRSEPGWTTLRYAPLLDRSKDQAVDGIWDEDPNCVQDAVGDAQEVAATVRRNQRCRSKAADGHVPNKPNGRP